MYRNSHLTNSIDNPYSGVSFTSLFDFFFFIWPVVHRKALGF
jgi:hypothetical protein